MARQKRKETDCDNQVLFDLQVSSCKACASEHPLRLMIPSANAVSRLKTLSRPILQAKKMDAKAEKLVKLTGIVFPISFSINSCLLRPSLPRLVPTPAQSCFSRFPASKSNLFTDIVRSPRVILGLKMSEFAINKPQMPDIAALLPVQNIAGSRFRPADD